MRYRIKRFKEMSSAIKELQPFILDGEHLQTGKPFKRFAGLRSREILANWLLCVVMRFENGRSDIYFTSDPHGGDGLIYDEALQVGFPTEHILVSNRGPEQSASAGSRIIGAIKKKRAKGGKAYASGKVLVIFLNSNSGVWSPNLVARGMPSPLHFIEVWVVALQGVDNGDYLYAVTKLDIQSGSAPVWLVRIDATFSSWTVTRTQ